MPIAANTVIVDGSAIDCPTTCSFWLRPKRVKSGMLSDSVDQNAIVPVSDGISTAHKVVCAALSSNDVRERIGPRPPARQIAQPTRIAVITSTYGAAHRSTRRSTSMPLKITSTLRPQNNKNEI